MSGFSKSVALGQHGKVMNNCFALAPMTNQQSNADGTLSDDELKWLTMRAEGGFAMVMTCAAHVSQNGQGWPGALGVFDDKHIPGLRRLAKALTDNGSLAIVQLFHGGIRAPQALINEAPVSASAHEETGSRALETHEVKAIVQDFINAAVRCEEAGMSGVALHGAHGYLICQFLSEQYNQRGDEYGGSFENRTRFLREILSGVRQATSHEFIVGLRLSPEKMGLKFTEMRDLAASLMASGNIDFLDMSLWDCFKQPDDEAFQQKSLLEWYTELPRHGVKLAVAGKLHHPADVEKVLAAGVDFVALGKAGILNHDFPSQSIKNVEFAPRVLPVSRETLKDEGLGSSFIEYMSRWPGFVAD